MGDQRGRRLQRLAEQYRIDLMVHRIAMSELYRDTPTRVRCGWAFADFIGAHVILDEADREREKAKKPGRQ